MKINNTAPGKFTSPAEVRLVRTLPGPIERVWEYLTNDEKRSRWFAGGPMEQKVGGKFELFFLHKNLAPNETPPEKMKQVQEVGFKMPGTILRWEPPRVLSYTFDEDSEVTFELTSEGKDVTLVLTHRCGPADLSDITGYASGWDTHVALLLALLEGKPLPPFWATHARLKGEYIQALANLGRENKT